MSNSENIGSLQHEKLKLHYRYLVVIAIILLLGSIVLATYNQNEFVSQISFAGTITSIILSVIAIWMSISGERSTNDIKMKILESTERLSSTTQNVETLNQKYEKTMDTQLDELKNVQEQLSKIVNSVDSVNEQLNQMNRKVDKHSASPGSIDNNIMDTNQKIRFFKEIYAWAIEGDNYLELLFCQMIYIDIIRNKKYGTYNYNALIQQLMQSGVNINYWIRAIDINWGIINALSAAAIFSDEEAVNKILEIVQCKINISLFTI